MTTPIETVIKRLHPQDGDLIIIKSVQGDINVQGIKQLSAGFREHGTVVHFLLLPPEAEIALLNEEQLKAVGLQRIVPK